MAISYLDTSAAMKVLFDEPESQALIDMLAGRGEQTLIASWLLHTELHCAAGRRGGIDPASLSMVLAAVNLIDMDRGHLVAAGALAPLRAQDAIHLAVALRLSADEMITYDSELADAAHRAGLRVLSPA